MVLNENSGDDRKAHVEFYLDKSLSPKHRFRMKYENGKIAAASSHGEHDKKDMVDNFRKLCLRRWAYRNEERGDRFFIVCMDTCEICEICEIEFYKTKSKGWRWRIYDNSDKSILGRSTEGYTKKSGLIDNFEYVVMTEWIVEDEE